MYLDISSLRFANIVKRGNSHRRVDFVRLQIWHGHASGSDRDDTGSIMTSGTVLSGPLKERTMPAISRLILFLGRAEEYISIFSKWIPLMLLSTTRFANLFAQLPMI